MFQRLVGIQVAGSTNAYYSLKPLMLVETAVRAVVSDEFALGPQARAWLDADELAVRRRIRDDLKAVLAAQGF
jgi:cellulose synthase operon protein C